MPANSIVFANPGWLWPVAGVLAAAAGLVALGYRRLPLTGWKKAAALTLKLTGLALLALSLLEPMLTGESPKKGANDLAILADNSRGLSVRAPASDGGAAPAAAGEAVAARLRGSDGSLPGWLETLGDTYRLQTYVFDGRLKRSADFSELDFSGDASALLTAVRSVRERFARRPLAGIFVFTDGNATDAAMLESVTRELAEPSGAGRAVPVYPVVAGADFESGRDVSIGAVTVTQSPFEDAPVTLSADLATLGLAGEEVVVMALDDGGAELARETFRVPAAGEAGAAATRRIRLRVPVAKPGLSFVKVAAAAKPVADLYAKDAAQFAKKAGELTLENNAQLVAVDRGQGPFRILYVGGRPNWDYKFLRRSLALDADVQVTALIRIAKREPKFEWRGRSGESSNPLFRGFESDIPEETQRYDQPVLIRLNTKDAEELRDGFPKADEALFGEYRAVILDDIEKDFFTAEQLNLLERFVSTRGGTLMMLGGRESFQQGGWENTPVSRLLPVYLDRVAGDGPALGATLNLTREGWLEPWVRLRAKQEEEEVRLATMPDFFSVNQSPAIKPGASLLATLTDSQKRVHPALVTQRYGEGRAASLLIGDLWRWGLKEPETMADLEKFWRQLLRWLIVDVPGRIEVETRQDTEGANPAVRFAVRVRDAAFRVQEDASVRVEIAGPGDEKAELFAEPSLSEGGLFEATHYPRQAGAYRAKSTVRDSEGTVLGENETGWALNPAADEFASLTPNRALLRSLADASGGRVLELDEAEEFMKSLPNSQAPVTETWSRPLWHAPWWFLLALACFAGEWGIRRWQGVL
ncbi:MAG: hypothetical protein H7A53_06440 [Akkermansiaceae bacterium]|nr:hypothetical protein [Akkermansiaceae bacterium]